MNYRQDHIRLLRVFAKELPKRPSIKVATLAKAAFSDIQKRKPDCASLSPDRACRNALRKPRGEGHIEIAERGEYRLTQLGAGFCKNLDKFVAAPDRGDGEPRAKKASKKIGKKVVKKAGKKLVKAAKVEKTVAKKISAPAVVETKKVVDKQEAKPTKKATVVENNVSKVVKPILPPSRKPAKPTAEEQADAAAKAIEAGEANADEVGGDPEPIEDIAAQLNLD